MAYDTTELRKPVFSQFWAVKIVWPGVTARFFSGRGRCTILGETYYGAGIAGEDGVFGDLEAIEGSVGDAAPRVKLTLGGLQTSLLDDARNYMTQGSVGIVYDCLWSGAANDLVGDPELAFYGIVDVISFEVGETLAISVDLVSALEWFFNTEQGERWTDPIQRGIYPDDYGFEFVTDTTRRLPFGIENEARPAFTGSGSPPAVIPFRGLNGYGGFNI